jgi:hypothetical protein
MEMNRLRTKTNLNIIPLGLYDYLIGMDWLDQHHVILDCYNKAFICLDEEGNLRTIQRIPRVVTIREVSSLQLKKSTRKDIKYLQRTWKRHLRIKCQVLKISQH